MTTIQEPPTPLAPLEQIIYLLVQRWAREQQAKVTVRIDGPGTDMCQYTIDERTEWEKKQQPRGDNEK